MDKEKIFRLCFKIGLPILLLVIIAVFGVYFYSLITKDAGILGIMPLLFMGLGLVGGIASLLLFISWVIATLEILQSEKSTTAWKIGWILLFVLGIWPIGLIYYYFWGRKKLKSKKPQ